MSEKMLFAATSLDAFKSATPEMMEAVLENTSMKIFLKADSCAGKGMSTPVECMAQQAQAHGGRQVIMDVGYSSSELLGAKK